MSNMSYESVMARKNEIMKQAMGMDYNEFITGKFAFDYEKMMAHTGYSLDDIRSIQRDTKVGNTPLFELKNITALVRKYSKNGFGARIFLKDEAANASGSFKARRASVSVYEAQKKGYKGVIAATSGNYGAAVAAAAAQRNLKCIICQEVFDSSFKGQPEIIEKSRKCEAYGAEVIQLSVGPELFYYLLCILEETGFFNASLYTPFGIAGVETLGYELTEQVREAAGKDPEHVIVTHAGGGNLTGTARGVIKSGAENTNIIASSVDLTGLHMASDKAFNKKSFTTGHTGFGIPFATWPDRVDVPKNAARALRYMSDYILVKQGEVFYTTELLAQLEGLERGPAGNVSLAAAINFARTRPEDEIIVVQETEYTNAGKHPVAQLNFAKSNGIEIKRGNSKESIPGKNIIIPETLEHMNLEKYPIEKLIRSYIKKAVSVNGSKEFDTVDLEFMAEDTNITVEEVKQLVEES